MHDFVRVDAKELDAAETYRLTVGSVVPRPVAWVTTVGPGGRVNAAPFSSYNYVATDPAMLAINIMSRGGHLKDTATNLRENGEFVVNVATEATLEVMHASSAEYAFDESETELLDIPLMPSTHVQPPRIASTPIQMECRLVHILPLGRGGNVLHIGEVLAFHLSKEVYDGNRLDSVGMRPVARMGGPFYATLGEVLHRPIPQKPGRTAE